jgi:hypothetical protein
MNLSSMAYMITCQASADHSDTASADRQVRLPDQREPEPDEVYSEQHREDRSQAPSMVRVFATGIFHRRFWRSHA